MILTKTIPNYQWVVKNLSFHLLNRVFNIMNGAKPIFQHFIFILFQREYKYNLQCFYIRLFFKYNQVMFYSDIINRFEFQSKQP